MHLPQSSILCTQSSCSAILLQAAGLFSLQLRQREWIKLACHYTRSTLRFLWDYISRIKATKPNQLCSLLLLWRTGKRINRFNKIEMKDASASQQWGYSARCSIVALDHVKLAQLLKTLQSTLVSSNKNMMSLLTLLRFTLYQNTICACASHHISVVLVLWILLHRRRLHNKIILWNNTGCIVLNGIFSLHFLIKIFH